MVFFLVSAHVAVKCSSEITEDLTAMQCRNGSKNLEIDKVFFCRFV
jgi:hypothetical protein